MLTDIQGRDENTGEYKPAELTIPDDYSAVLVKQTGSDPAPAADAGNTAAEQPAQKADGSSGGTEDDTPSAKTGIPANYALLAVSLILMATAFHRKED